MRRVSLASRGKPSTTVFPTLVASPQTPDRTEEIIAVATLWTRQRGEKLSENEQRKTSEAER